MTTGTDQDETAIEHPDSSMCESLVFDCGECDGSVTVWTSDPYYPDYVNCPQCGALISRV